MDKDTKKKSDFRARDAAALGGVAGGIWGTSLPLKDPRAVNDAVYSQIYDNPNIPGYLEEPAIMTSGGVTALMGAGLGSLGGLAAYKLIEKAGEGVKALKKANDRRFQRKVALYNTSNNIKVNNS